MKFLLPPQKALLWTNVEDPIKYYYYPFIGYFYRKRVQTGVQTKNGVVGRKR